MLLQHHRLTAQVPFSSATVFRQGTVPLYSVKTKQRVRIKQMCTSAHLGFTKSEEYNAEMKLQMGWDNPYEYHYDRGLYYHEIFPNVICGSQPRNPDDVRYLKEQENVTYILNLQQDRDLHHWNVNIHDLQHRAHELGMQLHRKPARDFDPHSLRATLPSTVGTLDEAVQHGHRVYVHCTAGLGRAPAVVIAYLYWFQGMTLDSAYKHLTDIRPCGPKRDAIRGATYDLMERRDWHDFDRLPSHAWSDLNEDQRKTIQRRVKRAAKHHHNHHHHHHHHHH